MIIEESYIRFMGEDDINDVLSFALRFGIEGRGIMELDENPYIEFDEPVNNSLLMDVGQFLVVAETEGESRKFILDKLEFDNRFKSGEIIEFERLVNILVPALSESADIYQTISDVMEIDIYAHEGKRVTVNGIEVEISLNFDQSIPNSFKVDLI